MSLSAQKAVILVLAPLLFIGVGGCKREGVRAAPAQRRTALLSASADLVSLGLTRPALLLQEEAWKVGRDPSQAMELAVKYDLFMGEGAGGACLARLYPTIERPVEVTNFMIDSFLGGWRWQEARAILEEKGDDPRLYAVQDILSRSKGIQESFDPPYALSWRVTGWRAEPVDGALGLFRAGTGKAGAWTPVGWNGRGFRQSIELKAEELIAGASFYFGFTTVSTLEGAGQSVLFECAEKRVSLTCSRAGVDARPEDAREWFFPAGPWLRIEIEYVPDLAFLREEEGMARGLIRACLSKRGDAGRLLTLEIGWDHGFEEGLMEAGLFLGEGGGPAKRSSWTVLVDNFTFEN